MTYRIPLPVPEITYAQAIEHIKGLVRLGICPLLETVEEMLHELGDPDKHLTCLQIAGTNGKTSTARYAAAILAGEGIRTALYTSPELVHYTERMEIDGLPVSEELFSLGVAAAREAGERINARREQEGMRPYDVTEFDTLTVAAMVAFALSGVEVAVLEVGMGGRWDATSAVKSIRSVAVTGIDLDHTRILGDTREQIAAEKAAVIQAGRTCVLGVGTAMPESVEDVFLQRAQEQGVTPVLLRADCADDVRGIVSPGIPRVHQHLPRATFTVAERPTGLGTPLSLVVRTPRATYSSIEAIRPSYQAANIACAICLIETFVDHKLDVRALRESVMACPTPGRFDVVRREPLALIDACHNPQSVRVFLEAIRSMEPEVGRRPTLLCAVLSDKDVDGIVRLLAPEFPHVVVTSTASHRALAPDRLAQVFRTHGKDPVHVSEDIGGAVEWLADTPFVACGSITTAGEVAALLRS